MKKAAEFVARMIDAASRFNETVAGLKPPKRPQVPHPTRVKWATSAFREEIQEFEEACARGDVPEAADALLDLMYFAAGRLHEMGVPPNAVLDEVQRANMDKTRGALAKRPGSMGHDAIKPEGWTPPDHSWLNRPDLLAALDAWDRMSPVLRRVALLRIRKGEDYNSGIQLRDYFPFGHKSYLQMIHLKATRLRSLLERIEAGGTPNFEGLEDTNDDLINYASFYGEWLAGEKQ